MDCVSRNIMTQAAQDLLHQQALFVPFSQDLIDDAQAAYLQLMDELGSSGEVVEFCRPGELQLDLGLIQRRGKAGNDIKDYIHFAHDLHLHLAGPCRVLEAKLKSQLVILKRLYDELNQLGIALATVLDETYTDYFVVSLQEEVRQAAKVSQPYSTTTLRGLRYPPVVGQRGAKSHIDRSLFSIHCGDVGGELFTEAGECGEKTDNLSPAKGQVVIFPGVKLWLLSQGRIKPTWHYPR